MQTQHHKQYNLHMKSSLKTQTMLEIPSINNLLLWTWCRQRLKNHITNKNACILQTMSATWVRNGNNKNVTPHDEAYQLFHSISMASCNKFVLFLFLTRNCKRDKEVNQEMRLFAESNLDKRLGSAARLQLFDSWNHSDGNTQETTRGRYKSEHLGRDSNEDGTNKQTTETVSWGEDAGEWVATHTP